VLQCREDAIAPESVGRFVADRLPDARLVILDAVGHCPNLSAPEETATAIEEFLSG
jgi:sigma-B regulation protein RsbQ